jgi:hypothetical protein
LQEGRLVEKEIHPLGIGDVIFRPYLAIASLSPTNAAAGGPAFTLTVNGSGFASGCSVQWNGSPRSTTFVSSTQVTAAVTAADVQTSGTATITVANTSPAGTSAGVSFSVIPSISDIVNVLNGIATMTADQFPAQQPALVNAANNLQGYLTNQGATINTLNAQLSDANSQVGSLTSQNASLNQQVQQQAAQITTLQSQVAAAQNQTASPFEIAQSLKNVVDKIQQTAASTPGMQSTLTNLNVQMKTLVNVSRDAQTGEASAQLVFPDPSALPDPSSLSTVSLSFGAIPNIHGAVSSGAGALGASSSAGASGGSASVAGQAGVPSPPSQQMAPVPPRGGAPPPERHEPFDDPSGRRHWFRRSRALRDGTLPAGLIGRESIKKHKLERELRRQRRMQMEAAQAARAPSPAAAQTPPTAAPAEMFAPAPPGGPGTTNWSLLGPDQVGGGAGGAQTVVVSGRITCLAVGPGGSRVYAGAANGGVWYSGDGGATWTPLDQYATMSQTETTPVEADSLAIGAIAVLFGTTASSSSSDSSSSSSDSSSASAGGVGAFADTIYVGTGEPNGNLDAYYGIGIKHSTDGGVTFSIEGTNLATSEVYRIVIDPIDPTIVFAATTSGIYRRPAGPDFSSWTKVADPDTNIPGSPIVDLVVAGSGDTRIYYAATVNQVFHSGDIFKKADGSATWSVVSGITNPSSDPLNNPLRKSMSVGESDRSVVYCLVQGLSGAGQADFTLFRLDSTTGGAFSPVTIPSTVSLLSGQGWYDIVVATDPSNANTIYLVGSLTWDSSGWALAMYKGTLAPASGGFAFTGGGPTWIGRGVHPDGHVLAFATNADGTHDGTNVWIGCDGGIFQSSSSGAAGTFSAKNVGLSITQITFLALRADTADELYAGCQDNGTIRYTASSTPPWNQSGSGDGGGVAINPNPANTSQIIRQYIYGSLEASTDDGKTIPWPGAGFPLATIDWSTMNSTQLQAYPEYKAGPFYGPVRVQFSGSKSLIAFGTNRLWFRSDWSDPWVTLPTGTNPYSASTPSLTQDVLDSTVGANVTAIAFGSPTMILVATSGGGSNGKIWRFDQQSGGNWTLTQQPAIINLPAPSLIFITGLVVEDATRGSFYAALGSAGGEHILYYDGAQWQSAGLAATTLDVPAHAVVIHPADSNTLFLGTDVGVYKGVKNAASASSSSSSSDSSSSSATTSYAWTWTPFSQGLPESAVQDLAIQATAQKLRAATHGRGVWEIPIDWPSSSSSDSSSSDSSSSSSDSSSSDSSSSDSSSSDSSSSDSSSSDSSSSDSSSSDSSSSDSSSSDSSSSDSSSSDSSSSDSSSSDSSSSDSSSSDSSSSDSSSSDSSSSDSSSSDSSSSDSSSSDSSSSDSSSSDSSSSDSSSSDSSSSDSSSSDSSSSDSSSSDSSSSDSSSSDSSSSDSSSSDSSSSDSSSSDSSSSDSSLDSSTPAGFGGAHSPAAQKKSGWLSWLRR